MTKSSGPNSNEHRIGLWSSGIRIHFHIRSPFAFSSRLYINFNSPLFEDIMPRNREKSIQRASSSQQRAKRNSRRKSKATDEPSTRTFDTNEMTGDLPPFNDWATWVVDHESRKVYTYGGCRPGGDIIPTSDFYCCDMQTLQWQNHTVSHLNNCIRQLTADLWA